MNKSDLIAQLHTVLNTFVFGIALRCHFPPLLWPQLANEQLEFGNGEKAIIKLAPLIERLSNKDDQEDLFNEYEKSLKRSLLREGHELILAYCEATNQFALYKAQTWFQFARIIRNIVSHKDSGMLRTWPKDLAENGIKDVQWRGRTLDDSMVGSAVKFTPYEAIQLFDDQMRFIQTTLT